jgi:hypothetical protein
MSKLDLRNTTFVCGDGIPEHRETINRIIKKTESSIDFGEVIYEDKNLTSLKDYNLWVANRLNEIVKTDYCLVFQWDGYPLNIEAWNKDWFKYDYIGAPWLNQPHPLNSTVGNGGFSLRSKRYLEETAKAYYDGEQPEDVYFCRQNKLDCNYAPTGVAYYFSVEDLPYKGQFGFHGQATVRINQMHGIFQ